MVSLYPWFAPQILDPKCGFQLDAVEYKLSLCCDILGPSSAARSGGRKLVCFCLQACVLPVPLCLQQIHTEA